jgi:hypothetical protein
MLSARTGEHHVLDDHVLRAVRVEPAPIGRLDCDRVVVVVDGAVVDVEVGPRRVDAIGVEAADERTRWCRMVRVRVRVGEAG